MKKKLTYHNFYFYLLLLSPILVVFIWKVVETNFLTA